MYIGVTVDLNKYGAEPIDLRISNYLTIRKVVEIAWQIQKIDDPPPSGYWVKILNKEKVCSGYEVLLDCGITNGDRIEIL